MGRWNNYEVSPYSEPNDEYYEAEIEKIDQSLEQFCKISQIDKKNVLVDVKSLREVIKRVDMRDLYFHVFHDNMSANEYKRTGLTVFWILKLKPFWLYVDPTKDVDEKTLTLASTFNEKFALHLVVTLLMEYNYDFINKGEDLLAAYYDELEYSFRYRDLSKESLFLMFDPFYYLYFYNSSVNDKGERLI